MVSPDRRFKLLPDHTLELRNIKPSDGGDYSCKISVMGDPIEITHTLEILCKCHISRLTFFFGMRVQFLRKKTDPAFLTEANLNFEKKINVEL